MRQREALLESTEDAIEAGILAEMEKSESSDKGQSSKSVSPVDKEESDSDLELGDSLFPGKKSRKRKVIDIEAPVLEQKKLKTEEIVVKNSETDKKPVSIKVTVEETKQVSVSKKAAKAVEADKEQKNIEAKQYDPIDIENISEAKELEAFGLDHLKHELECEFIKFFCSFFNLNF